MVRWTLRWWLKAGLGMACAIAAIGAARAQGFTPDLLFHSLRHGASQVYLADSSSGEARRLREGASGDEDIDATWSPDGKRLLFTGRKATNSEVFVADADGSNLRQLTDHPGFDGGARWAPDGKTIAFLSSRSGPSKLFLMDADGGNLRRLTKLDDGDESDHSWSADGQRLALVIHTNRRNSVWTARSDGSGLARLTSENVNEIYPAWAPDGKQLAYLRQTRSDAQLRVVNLADGSHRELAAGVARKSNLAFSADGQRIVFEGVEAGAASSEIYAVPIAGGEVLNLSNDAAEDMAADVSANGQQLAFVSYRNGPVGQVYLKDLRSGAVKRFTSTNKHEFRPVWRPQAVNAGA